MQRKNILVTNDDGIEAPGIKAIVLALVSQDRYNVTVVAPSEDQSGKSCSLTIHHPIVVRPHIYQEPKLSQIEAYSVAGTPVDCVMLATGTIFAQTKFDLIVSGINKGNNAGLNVLYSGTVGACLKARHAGFNAIAISLDHVRTYVTGQPFDRDEWNFELAARESIAIVDVVLQHDPLHRVLLNVNVPNLESKAQLKGIKQTRQGWSSWDTVFQVVESKDAMDSKDGVRAYTNRGVPNIVDTDPMCDTLAMRQGWIAVTPLGVHLDPFNVEEYKASWNALAQWDIFKPK